MTENREEPDAKIEPINFEWQKQPAGRLILVARHRCEKASRTDPNTSCSTSNSVSLLDEELTMDELSNVTPIKSLKFGVNNNSKFYIPKSEKKKQKKQRKERKDDSENVDLFVEVLKQKQTIVNYLEKKLECTICYNTLHDPIQSTACRHIFCSYCYYETLSARNSCPTCNETVKKLVKSPVILSEMLEEYLHMNPEAILPDEEIARRMQRVDELKRRFELRNEGRLQPWERHQTRVRQERERVPITLDNLHQLRNPNNSLNRQNYFYGRIINAPHNWENRDSFINFNQNGDNNRPFGNFTH